MSSDCKKNLKTHYAFTGTFSHQLSAENSITSGGLSACGWCKLGLLGTTSPANQTEAHVTTTILGQKRDRLTKGRTPPSCLPAWGPCRHERGRSPVRRGRVKFRSSDRHGPPAASRKLWAAQLGGHVGALRAKHAQAVRTLGTRGKAFLGTRRPAQVTALLEWKLSRMVFVSNWLIYLVLFYLNEFLNTYLRSTLQNILCDQFFKAQFTRKSSERCFVRHWGVSARVAVNRCMNERFPGSVGGSAEPRGLAGQARKALP